MPIPQPGDILIRNVKQNHFELVDVISLKHLAGPFEGFPSAVIAARALGVQTVWQQNVDDRGRPVGDLFRLPDL